MSFSEVDYDEALAEFEGPGRFEAQPEPEAPQMGSELYSCDQCDFTSKSAPGLRRHITRQHGPGPGGEAAAPSPPAPSRRRDSLHDQAEAFTMFFYTMLGGIWAQADPVCGQAWADCGPAATEAWYQAGKKNKTIRRMLESTENVGIVGQLAVAHMPVLVAVQQHHIAPRIDAARRRAEEAQYEPEPEPDLTADHIPPSGYNGAPG